jgi:hypothetical protein
MGGKGVPSQKMPNTCRFLANDKNFVGNKKHKGP